MSEIRIQVRPGDSIVVEAADALPATTTTSRDYNPMTQSQRSALFGQWSDAFGRSPEAGQRQRHLFTAAVLGADVNPSWSGSGITSAQADHLLTVLGVINALP